MKRDKNAIIKRTSDKGGRRSKNNAELWARRVRVFRLWAMGATKSEIAAEYNVSPETINNDLEACAILEPFEDMIKKVDAHLKEVVRTAFEQINKDGTPETAKVGYLNSINDACSKLSRLHGIEKEQNNFYMTAVNNNISTGGANRYDKWDDHELQKEFDRRRLKV